MARAQQVLCRNDTRRRDSHTACVPLGRPTNLSSQSDEAAVIIPIVLTGNRGREKQRKSLVVPLPAGDGAGSEHSAAWLPCPPSLVPRPCQAAPPPKAALLTQL